MNYRAYSLFATRQNFGEPYKGWRLKRAAIEIRSFFRCLDSADLPQLDRFVRTVRCECLAIRTERHGETIAGMPFQGGDDLPCRYIP